MENPDILENLFNFLPLSALGTCRLVCKVWNHEAVKKIRKRHHLVVLSTRENFKKFKNVLDTSARFPGNELLLFKQWSLVFTELALEEDCVQDLINSYGSYVNKLRIRFDCRIMGNFPTTFHQLLVKQMPNLVELEFFGFPEPIWQQTQLFDEETPGLFLPNLTSLTAISCQGYRHALECPLYLNILSCLQPNQLQTLKINCKNYIRIIFTEASKSRSNKLRSSLNGLKVFSMICPDNVEADLDIEICQPINEIDILLDLLRVCPRLANLQLCLGIIGQDAVNYICSALSNTLVELQLTDHCRPNITDRQPRGVTPQLLPLPNLEKATMQDFAFLYDCTTTMKNFPKLKYWKTNCCITWPIPVQSSVICYPQLSTLVLSHNRLSASPHYETFSTDKIEIIGKSFPNLKTFHLKSVTYEIFHAICTELQSLEELHVESDLSTVEAHMDSGVTGFSLDSCYNILNRIDAAPNQEALIANSRFYPFVGNLKHLQRLHIKAAVSALAFAYGFCEANELTNLYVEILQILPGTNLHAEENKNLACSSSTFLRKLPKLVKLEILSSDPNYTHTMFSDNILKFDKTEFFKLQLTVDGKAV